MCRLEEGNDDLSFCTVPHSMLSGPKIQKPNWHLQEADLITRPFHPVGHLFTTVFWSKDVLYLEACVQKLCVCVCVCLFFYWFISLGSVSLPHHYFFDLHISISTFTMTLWALLSLLRSHPSSSSSHNTPQLDLSKKLFPDKSLLCSKICPDLPHCL